jgi:hypothetical protein
MSRGWFAENHEQLPLEGHEPTARLIADGQWLPACRTDQCIDTDPGLLMHPDPVSASDDARHTITRRIHGPQEVTP